MSGAGDPSIVAALEAQLAACRAELDEARRQVALAGRARTNFLGSMTHELKTPMNAILGGARLLLESALSAEQRDHVRGTIAAGEAMMALIDDALDYSALDRGELAIAAAPFDLHDLLDSVVSLHVTHADQKGIDLATVIGPGVPTHVVGDAARLRQIVRKLLSNAITFTETGSIALRVRTGEAGRIRFEVDDTGIGIAGEMVAHLFEAFAQADTSATRRHGGTGLGLAICRRLTEAMGGTIGVTSAVGVGSRFWVELPLAAAPGREARAPRCDGRHAVVLCRGRASRLAIESELAILGFGVTMVDDADTAAAHLGCGERTDLLVLDLRTPDLDALMSLPAHALPAGALVLAARLERQALPAALAGCASWVPRPIQRRRLRESVARLFGQPTDIEAAEAAPVASLRILAADDYPANLRIVTRLLEKRGHTVETVTTGTAAAAAVLASQYDLVLMDCRMPEMDGWEATALIRSQEVDGRRTPIIALTANDAEEDRQRCFAVGMDAFVAKPLKPEELFAAMAQVGVGSASAAAIGPAPPAGATARPTAMPAGPGPAVPVTEADLWIELAHAIAGLTHDAELALTHVGPGGAGNIRAVIRAAVRAREIAQRLRPNVPDPVTS